MNSSTHGKIFKFVFIDLDLERKNRVLTHIWVILGEHFNLIGKKKYLPQLVTNGSHYDNPKYFAHQTNHLAVIAILNPCLKTALLDRGTLKIFNNFFKKNYDELCDENYRQN